MNYSLSDSEQLIMNLLWKNKHWMTIAELSMELEKEGVFWKRQTINTFLSRLIKKDMVVQNSRKYIYAHTKDEYETLRAQEYLTNEHGGSLRKFIAALSGHAEIDEEDTAALLQYLEKFK